jgi:hypothetical protein
MLRAAAGRAVRGGDRTEGSVEADGCSTT